METSWSDTQELEAKIRVRVEEFVNKHFNKPDKLFPYLISLEIALVAGAFYALYTTDILLPVFLFVASICFISSFFFRLWNIARKGKRFEIFQQKQKETLKKCSDFYKKFLDFIRDNVELKAKLAFLENKDTTKDIQNVEKSVKYAIEEVQNELNGRFAFIVDLLSVFVANEAASNSEQAFLKSLDEGFSKPKMILDYLAHRVKNKLLIMGILILLFGAFWELLIQVPNL